MTNLFDTQVSTTSNQINQAGFGSFLFLDFFGSFADVLSLNYDDLLNYDIWSM